MKHAWILAFLAGCALLPQAAHVPFPRPRGTASESTLEVYKATSPFGRYVTLNLPFPPYDQLRKDLEKRLGIVLQNRGEAHITLLTPPEIDQALARHLSMEEIESLTKKAKAQDFAFENVCMGRSSVNLDGNGEQTYYVVVKSKSFLEYRQQIQNAFVAKGGDIKAFDPGRFFPHITLGFTKRDLHESDGAIKDESSCFAGFTQVAP